MPKPAAKRPGLDRTSVVRAAADLVNREGIGALTINRLARTLHVQPPSLYNHIAGLDELWRELALYNLHGLGERVTQAVLGRSGPAGIMALAQAYRAYAKEFPGLYQSSLRVSGNMDQPDGALQFAEARLLRVTLAMVETLGVTGEEAIYTVRALRSAIHGFVSLEAAGGFGLPLDLDESFRRLIDMIIRGITQQESS